MNIPVKIPDDILAVEADALAERLHAGQMRKSFDGKHALPYIVHPRAVRDLALAWFDFALLRYRAAPELKQKLAAVALLHDVLEDTDISIDELALLGYPQVVLVALDFLTKRKDQEYSDYVTRIVATLPEAGLVDMPAVPHKVYLEARLIARIAKWADLHDNLRTLHKGSLRDKYRLSLHMISEALNSGPTLSDSRRLDPVELLKFVSGKKLHDVLNAGHKS